MNTVLHYWNWGCLWMLYRTLRRLIELGRTEGLQDKLDVFYAAGRITEAEYTELSGQLEV